MSISAFQSVVQEMTEFRKLLHRHPELAGCEKWTCAEIRRRLAELAEQGVMAVAVDAPTLIESGFHRECDTVVVVLSSKKTRIARIMARDGLSRVRAEERVNAQKPDDFYREAADAVLYNDGDREALFKGFEALLTTERSENT